MSVKAPFPVPSYIEPFAGSLAVPLARSHVFGKGGPLVAEAHEGACVWFGAVGFRIQSAFNSI
jgi:hypothetical protein